MGGNPRFWLAAQNRAAGGKKCFPPFPAGQTFAYDQASEQNEKASGKAAFVFRRQEKLAAAADGAQAGAGQGASERERRARELPPEGERRGSTGEPASREAWPEARRAEGAELGWGPQRSRLAGAPVTQRKICGADPASAGALKARTARGGCPAAEQTPERSCSLLQPARGGCEASPKDQSKASLPDDDNEIGHALVVLVHKLDVLPAGDPKNWLAFTMDPQKVALDPGGRKEDELEFAIAALLDELHAVGGLELKRPPCFLVPPQPGPPAPTANPPALIP
jgi:hypothetical protein